MAEFEIYFSGLMCFICNGTRFETVDLVKDAEHRPLVWLGPSAKTLTTPIELSGQTISIDLPGGGPVCDPNPTSPIVHLQPLIEGSPVLMKNRQIAGRMLLPTGKRRVSLKMDDAEVKHPNGPTTRQAVSQMVVVICDDTDAAQIKVTVGAKSDVVNPSSFMVLGNLSAKHDPKSNHFKKYKNLTQGGGDIGSITGGKYDSTPHAGTHAKDAYDFIVEQIPKPNLLTPREITDPSLLTAMRVPKGTIVTVGAPDCTITQWP